ncbi:DUF551 domain-containing protein [Klebsiella quasipneumoniae]|uniref:DUF551 domain-containing protein n=1 Tax=Klebsiella quasipneumoniae TaxID=1463165 RepID=UPI0010DD5D90|nr:DUF551 domain-containing protein [Klebsiella quasipneumoniae]UDC53451.1 DUF551 domain-containing protein [Klebsiella quasipneumoniae subsp. quasipneumoniae]VGP27234.1 hypothetical protein SB02110_03351 [Klebsiella quasipneumoniae subsp. quasipneumoniae]
MTSKLTREENVQAVFDLKAGYTLGLADVEILKRVARMALAAMDSDPVAHVDPHCVHNIIWTDYGVALENIGVGAPLFAAPQPAPVMPDGYVLVPKEPTEEMNKAGWYAMNEHDAINPTYRAMLAAAQHDTPALNSLQSVDSVAGKWIPVSERMPEDRISVILWDAEIGEVTSGHYSHKTQTFYHCGDAIENEITHWMPPPCAPQEVKGEHQIRDEMDMGARITSHRFKV